MKANKLDLALVVRTMESLDKTRTHWLKLSKPRLSETTSKNSMGSSLKTFNESPEQRPNTPVNESATASGDFQNFSEDVGSTIGNAKRITTYRTPLFSLFPPVSREGSMFGEVDSESTENWKTAYRNARHLMDRKKARYLALRRNSPEKVILCTECETKGEKALRISQRQNRKKQSEDKNSYDLLIEGHLVEESEKQRYVTRGIPANISFSLRHGKAMSFESSDGKKQRNKPMGKSVLPSISFEKLQPWIPHEKQKESSVLKMDQDVGYSRWTMYLPHHR